MFFVSNHVSLVNSLDMFHSSRSKDDARSPRPSGLRAIIVGVLVFRVQLNIFWSVRVIWHTTSVVLERARKVQFTNRNLNMMQVTNPV
jgi:hypothetical protein